jgi:hypothetical protein
VRAVVAAEIRDSSTDSKILQPLSSPPRLRSIDLYFDGYILSGQLIELTLVALQCVDLAVAGKDRVGGIGAGHLSSSWLRWSKFRHPQNVDRLSCDRRFEK